MLLLRSLITGDPGAPAGGGTAVVSERPEVRGRMGRLDMETRVDFFLVFLENIETYVQHI